MLLKCSTRYASKFGKLSSGHRTGKKSVFIPISKKGNAKERSNYRTNALISHASKVCSKSFKLSFNSIWTKNFQIYKLDLDKAEEPEIKLPTFTGSYKKSREFQKNIYFCFIDYAKAFDCIDHNKLWKILKEMGIPDYLTCLLSNLYAGQEATVRTRHGTTDWFQIRKGVHQGCIMYPACLTYKQCTSCKILGWIKHKLESRLPREISITSDMQMTPPLWQKVKRN